jgi:predicted AAA+ superfamily ATPase
MPHQRFRALLDVLEKRLSLFPIVGVLGARQTGKSTLLRELLSKKRKIKYVTLDREEIREQAIRQPTLFVEGLESAGMQTVCIDEIQKAPALFDTLKAEVDEKKRPGRFAISGSTEFSKKTGVTESLTGRIALLRLFPLNGSEISGEKPSTLSAVKLWTQRGGMPGIFAIRESANREALFENWIETTCSRDMARFRIPKFNPELARRILASVAKSEVPNMSEIARSVGKQSRQIEAYIEAFKGLFVLYEVPPIPSSTGKPLFYVFDSGLAQSLGSTANRCLQIWFLNECLSHYSYSGKSRPDISYYQSSKGSRMDFVVETKGSTFAALLSDEEAPSVYSLRAAKAFAKREPKTLILVIAPCLYRQKIAKGIGIVPWNDIPF